MHLQAAKETAWKARELRNRELKERILAYRSPEKMAEAMYDYLILLAREDALQDGKPSLREDWPHKPKVCQACQMVVARLIAEERFKAECREEKNGGLDGFADIRELSVTVSW